MIKKKAEMKAALHDEELAMRCVEQAIRERKTPDLGALFAQMETAEEAKQRQEAEYASVQRQLA